MKRIAVNLTTNNSDLLKNTDLNADQIEETFIYRSKVLDEYLKENNISNSQFADKFGCTASYISNLRNYKPGKSSNRPISDKLALELHHVMGIPKNLIMGIPAEKNELKKVLNEAIQSISSLLSYDRNDTLLFEILASCDLEPETEIYIDKTSMKAGKKTITAYDPNSVPDNVLLGDLSVWIKCNDLKNKKTVYIDWNDLKKKRDFIADYIRFYIDHNPMKCYPDDRIHIRSNDK